MHLLWVLWFGYTWPSLQGNGPEALVQTLVYGALALAIYPPLRKWATREWDHVHAKLDANKKLLAHIIEHHPTIPNDHGINLPDDGRPKEG